MNIEQIPMKDIEVDYRFNCRDEEIVPSDVSDLMSAIKSEGLLSPVLVKPNKLNKKYKYFLFAGFRRFTACKYLKFENIPAIVHSDISDSMAEQLNLSENINRKNLNILQEAKGLSKLRNRGFNAQEIAEKLDQGGDWVRTRLLLLELPEEIQKEAAAGFLNARNIKDIFQVYKKSEKNAFELVKDIKNKKIRNENKDLTKSKKADNAIPSRRFRPFSEVFLVQDTIMEALGPSIASRAIAWAMCEISTHEFLSDIELECKMMQIPWTIPIIYNEQKFKEDKIRDSKD